MQQTYQATSLPTGASAAGGRNGGSAWSNPTRITTDDGSSASWAASMGGQSGTITGNSFVFPILPDSAVIDGLSVTIDGSQTGCFGYLSLNITGADSKDIGSLSGDYGGSNDLWGLDAITIADLAALTVTVDSEDVSGGDGFADIDYLSVTIYWHLELDTSPADVPTRLTYKVYSSEGSYLGDLPDVVSKFAFSQEKDSAGSSIQITCGKLLDNIVTVDPLLTDEDDIILTDSDQPILAVNTEILVALGNSANEALFKNGNRIKVFLYNQWHPNGKIMFSGQVNRITFTHGGGQSAVNLTVFSDGIDLDNYIARGYPFSYTTDVSQTSQNGYVVVSQNSYNPGWDRYGQTFLVGGSVSNIGAITLKLRGTATVTLTIYDAVNGNVLGSTTQSISAAISGVDIQFEFPTLIDVTPGGTYFMALSCASGQNFGVFRHSTSSTYANGSMYRSQYSGTSGGGSYTEVSGDFYFITKYGTPTTTTTYSSDDPVTEMASNILLDYNARGGLITERDFTATGLSLTYTFISATILDAIRKIIELCPTGYYSYVDLGTAEIDILPVSDQADFTVVKGKDVNDLTVSLSIEQVKNYLLFTGGETAPDVNLYREYSDTESMSNYGVRLTQRSDNRVTLTATSDALGNSFIEENSEEIQETTLSVLNEMMDITLLTPGKTIGFKNFGGFIDNMVLQIVRRDYRPDVVSLTLGRLPISASVEIQKLQRELLMEQTVNNPTSPS